MTTWRYTNPFGTTVMVPHPTIGNGNGAVLGPGQTVEFNTHTGDRVTVYDHAALIQAMALSPSSKPGEGKGVALVQAVLRSGPVGALAVQVGSP